MFALNILEGYDLKAMGHNSADYIHTSAEAIKLAFADREKYLGDMDFIKIPFEGLLSEEYAQRAAQADRSGPRVARVSSRHRRKFMTSTQASDRPVKVNLAGDADHEGDTSYIAVVDRDRNMISFTPSLHSAFGTGVVMGNLGFIFNCRGDYYSLVPGEANALAPGKRPRSTLQGTLVMKDGQPFMVTGTPGADDQVHADDADAAQHDRLRHERAAGDRSAAMVDARFPASPFPHTMYPGDLSVEARIPEAVRAALIAKGHKLRVAAPWSMGEIAAMVIDPKTGVLNAGADPRAEAYAWAW